MRTGTLVLLALPLTACIEERLDVELLTEVRTDGSCIRRVAYRFERADSETKDTLLPFQEDPLLKHRFPSGEAWTVTRERDGEARAVIAESSSLASPNEIDGDYWRVRGPKAKPVRNYVSFAASEGSSATYDYSETFLDPASPVDALRALSQALLKSENEFATRWSRAISDRGPSRSDLRRAYRERLAAPFARDVAALAGRPVFGPRERRDLEALLERLDALDEDLVQVLADATAEIDAGVLRQTTQLVFDEMAETLAGEIDALAELPTSVDGGIRFRATLVMPGPIVRANACVVGDTATWEFDATDLYGRGFEMRARAVVSR